MNKINRMLIALDDGLISEKIASIGFQFGKQLNAEIALISVADATGLMTDGGITPGELAEDIKNDLTKNQQHIIENVFKDYKVTCFVERGKTFEVILKVAEEWNADLIVLGTHGRTGLSHLLTGSVAEKVIRHSTLPLYIIPTKS